MVKTTHGESSFPWNDGWYPLNNDNNRSESVHFDNLFCGLSERSFVGGRRSMQRDAEINIIPQNYLTEMSSTTTNYVQQLSSVFPDSGESRTMSTSHGRFVVHPWDDGKTLQIYEYHFDDEDGPSGVVRFLIFDEIIDGFDISDSGLLVVRLSVTNKIIVYVFSTEESNWVILNQMNLPVSFSDDDDDNNYSSEKTWSKRVYITGGRYISSSSYNDNEGNEMIWLVNEGKLWVMDPYDEEEESSSYSSDSMDYIQSVEETPWSVSWDDNVLSSTGDTNCLYMWDSSSRKLDRLCVTINNQEYDIFDEQQQQQQQTNTFDYKRSTLMDSNALDDDLEINSLTCPMISRNHEWSFFKITPNEKDIIYVLKNNKAWCLNGHGCRQVQHYGKKTVRSSEKISSIAMISQSVTTTNINENEDEIIWLKTIVVGIPQKVQSITSRGSVEVYRAFEKQDEYNSTLYLNTELMDQTDSIKSHWGQFVCFLYGIVTTTNEDSQSQNRLSLMIATDPTDFYDKLMVVYPMMTDEYEQYFWSSSSSNDYTAGDYSLSNGDGGETLSPVILDDKYSIKSLGNLQSVCEDCSGVFYGTSANDECGVCDGDNTSCYGCDGIMHSSKEMDVCGICGGYHTSCLYVEGISYQLSQDISVPSFFREQFVGLSLSEDAFHSGSQLLPEGVTLTSDNVLKFTVVLEDDVCVNSALRMRIRMGKSRNFPLWTFFSGDVSQCPNVVHKSCSFDVLSSSNNNESQYNSTTTAMMEKTWIVYPSNGENHLDKIPLHFSIKYNVKSCVGCDGVEDSGVWFDSCGVCGGDESSCHDCAGTPGGNRTLNECGDCVDPTNEEETSKCFQVEDEMTDMWVQCGESQSTLYKPSHYPEDRLPVKWTIANRTHPFNYVNIDKRTGIITYHTQILVNKDDRDCYIAKHPYKNKDDGCITIHVTNCDVIGCDGVLGSSKELDLCGVCGGTNECFDCAGVKNGPHVIDESSGVCILDANGILDALIQQQQQGEANALYIGADDLANLEIGEDGNTLTIVLFSLGGVIVLFIVGMVLVFLFCSDRF